MSVPTSLEELAAEMLRIADDVYRDKGSAVVSTEELRTWAASLVARPASDLGLRLLERAEAHKRRSALDDSALLLEAADALAAKEDAAITAQLARNNDTLRALIADLEREVAVQTSRAVEGERQATLHCERAENNYKRAEAAEARLAAVAECAQEWRDRAFGSQHMTKLKSDTLEECAGDIEQALAAPAQPNEEKCSVHNVRAAACRDMGRKCQP